MRLLVPDLVNASVGKWERHCYFMYKYCQFHFLYACKESFYYKALIAVDKYLYEMDYWRESNDFSQSLRKEVDSIWEASFHHPFVKNSVKER